VAPMMLTHQPAVGPRIRRLQFFGADSSMTEIRGLVCRDGDQAAVIELLRDHFMAHAKEWDWIHWCGLRGDDLGYAAWFDRSGLLRKKRRLPDYYLPLPTSWDEFRSRFPGTSSNRFANAIIH
jgi:hypothetical protein